MSEILQASHSHLKEGVETLEIAVTFWKPRSTFRNHGKLIILLPLPSAIAGILTMALLVLLFIPILH
jgi:hypothetical protein